MKAAQTEMKNKAKYLGLTCLTLAVILFLGSAWHWIRNDFIFLGENGIPALVEMAAAVVFVVSYFFRMTRRGAIVYGLSALAIPFIALFEFVGMIFRLSAGGYSNGLIMSEYRLEAGVVLVYASAFLVNTFMHFRSKSTR